MRIISCFAATLDGKIGSAANLRDRVGSRDDFEHLLDIRNQADAILYGGETFRQHPLLRKGNRQEKAPLQCLLTQSFNLPPDVKLFQESAQSNPPVPIVIASPEPASSAVRERYPQHIEWLTTGTDNPVPTILAHLRDKNIETLMVEGGGHIFNLFLEAQAVQELYLTLCPLLLGGRNDPSLVTGQGFRVAQAPRTEVLSQEWRGQELYLHLKITYPT
nr:RibD C-terminal domain protein [uncultured bacterium]